MAHSAAIVDLRSDTVTRPSPAMRAAIAAAEVGDDVYREDPTVRRLEERVATLLGKEDAVFVPTGTMSNQIALRAWTEPADIVVMEAACHLHRYESGGPYALAGLTPRLIDSPRGVFTGVAAAAALAAANYMPLAHLQQPVKLLAIENTHNAGGGTVWPVGDLMAVAQAAQARGVALHCDGARLWNAAAALGVDPGFLAEPCDSVSVCFSKGLGAPMGSALVGPRGLVQRARRFKQLYGGGFRQAGMMAAAALHALDHHMAGLADDHRRARRLAEGLAELRGIEIDLAGVETNIVRFRLVGRAVEPFLERLRTEDVRMGGAGDAVRAVTHRDVDDDGIARALAAVRRALGP